MSSTKDLVFHSSSIRIEKIVRSDDTLFDSFLCFSSRLYSGLGSQNFVYTFELDDADCVRSRSLFYHEEAQKLQGFVDEVCSRFDCEESAAIKAIETQDYSHVSEDSEDGWYLQKIACLCARALGFSAMESQDEQGAVYFVDMFEKEAELKLVAKRNSDDSLVWNDEEAKRLARQ